MRIVTSDNGKHERGDQEALNLDPATAKDFDEINGQEVARYVTSRRNDQISVSVFEEGVVLRLPLRKANCSEQNGLIEVDTVEGHIDEEPGQ